MQAVETDYVESLVERRAIEHTVELAYMAMRIEDQTGCFLSYGGDSREFWVKMYRPKKTEEFDPSDPSASTLVFEETVKLKR